MELCNYNTKPDNQICIIEKNVAKKEDKNRR